MLVSREWTPSVRKNSVREIVFLPINLPLKGDSIFGIQEPGFFSFSPQYFSSATYRNIFSVEGSCLITSKLKQEAQGKSLLSNPHFLGGGGIFF